MSGEHIQCFIGYSWLFWILEHIGFIDVFYLQDNCSTRTVDLKDQHLKETRDVKKRLEEKLQSLAEEVVLLFSTLI